MTTSSVGVLADLPADDELLQVAAGQAGAGAWNARWP